MKQILRLLKHLLFDRIVKI